MTDPASQYSELYAAYAAGTLDPGYALMVETQGALRDDVRQSVAVSEAAAGMLLEAEEAAPMAEGALDRVFAAIDAGAAKTPQRAAADMPEINDIERLPEPVVKLARDAFARGGWKRPARGISRLNLDIGSDARVELYRIQPGATVPRHTHGAQEYTLVLAGGYSDATGSYGPGDLAVKGPDDTHVPVGDEGEVCYALIIHGGLRLTGAMGIVQRLLGR
ncbi:ChrR family anti-sigma-E factor [Hyphomonas oceanitis]|uniref:ChR family anti-sigma factor n=1 Tax=Hyphomonas oceanitis SCH89 TaxID=1280953 RepID=A0A059G7W3_9PROT|nr:ChrR family anti-sigma-E factor [Hyphomonas oceanitis]KDA02819.1 ChR family anti-sigma factor [Hyphomonas oceanitis SCH89]